MNWKRAIYPNRRVFLFALALALVVAAQYVLWIFFPPLTACPLASQGEVCPTVFNGMDGMEGHHLAGIRSVDNGFQDYWRMPTETQRSENVIVSSQGLYGPIYTQLALGMLHLATGMDVQLLWILFRAISTFLLVLAAYHLIAHFTRNEREKNASFLLYFLGAGFGGYIYFALYAAGGFATLPQTLFGFGFDGYRMVGSVVALSFALSIISILLNARGRIWAASLVAAVIVPLYPAHAMIALGLSALYHVVSEKQWKEKMRVIVKLAILPAAASLVWVIPNMINSYNFSVYFRQNSDLSYVFLPSLLVGIGLPTVFVAYELYKKYSVPQPSACRWLAALVVMAIFAAGLTLATAGSATLARIDASVPALMSSLGISGLVSQFTAFVPAFVALFLLANLYIALRVYFKKQWDTKYRFLMLWLIAMSAVTLLPPGYATIFPDKVVAFLFIPLMILGAKGLIMASQRFRVSHVKILALVLLVSFPTVFAWQFHRQMAARDNYLELGDSSFFAQDEYEALRFLDSQPQGTVFASQRMSSFTPLYANKKVVLGFANPGVYAFVEDGQQRLADYEAFYAAADEDEKKVILDRYDIKYVVYDQREQEMFKQNLDALPFLGKIFDRGAKVYAVRR